MNWNDPNDIRALRDQWCLRPGVRYLNHGSFGPAPRCVIEARAEWFRRLESEPVDFLTREAEPALDHARRRLGRFVAATADDLVFVDNATMAMNVVAANTPLEPGEEVLINDHEYGAVLRIWQRKCARCGARLVVQPIPCPVRSSEEVVAAFLAGASPRTRLLVVSHVTSPTAVVMPVAAICRQARALGIPVAIDGPHAVAMRPLDIAGLDCDYYAASCHKWLCAPFGAGFLYVHPRHQGRIEPLVTSWGTPPWGGPKRWIDEFTWAGTRDPSAFLAVPAAIDFLEALGIEEFRRHTHALAQLARQRISALTGLEPLVPDSPAWYGSMIALPLPAGDAAGLQKALWERFAIEIPLVAWQGRRLIRPSCHLYTQPEEIERLAAALAELL
jgi:isopenicillin-N epimerase